MPIFAPTPENLAHCARILQEGGVVAIPTETVYGLAGNALSTDAVELIYTIKNRPAYNPLIVHVPDVDRAKSLAASWTEFAEQLTAAFWPGPLTIVLPKGPEVPDTVTARLDSVALRQPNHPVALQLLHASGLPLAAPSANRSMAVSPTLPEHVIESLGEDIPVLDGGPCRVGIESTVVDLRGETPILLRPGIISRHELETIVGPVGSPSASEGSTAKPSPGMLDRHYAPKAQVHLFPTLTDAHFHAVLLGSGKKIGVLAFNPTKLKAEEILLPANPAEYAQRLYASLRTLDDAGCGLILIEEPPHTPTWEAVHDRLRRAAK